MPSYRYKRDQQQHASALKCLQLGMEDFERRQQREREKHKRQQVQSVNREHALFPEPRRVNPSEGDDDITAKLGDHSKAIEFMNLNSVGIYGNALQLPNNAALAGNMPTSASSSASAVGSTAFGGVPPNVSSLSSSQRLQPPQQQQPPPHHYQQSQQQSRQLPYVKQTDNKPPYNGRGGYPGQPVKNDARSSSGMAPPKGPPSLPPPQFSTIVGSGGSLNSASSSLLPPPATNIMPNGHLGPPTSTVGTHNGRFSKPSIPKKPAVSRVDSALENILNTVNQTYRAPQEITKIAATPHTTIGEYNLNGPNRHKYTFDPIQPLGSPPSGADLLQSTPVKPITALPQTPTLPVSSSAPVISNMAAAVAISSRSGEATQTMLQSVAPAASVTTTATSTTNARLSKEPLKPLTVEKVTPTLEKQNSTLLNDLELSESDDDRRKLSRSMHNSSDSSQSDSSESGSEESSKSEHQPTHSHYPPQQQQSQSQQPLLHSHHSHHGSMSAQQQQQQQQQPAALTSRSTPNSLAKTFPSKLKGSDTNRGGGIYPNSSTLGSAGSSSSGPSSTSSCNKTPSPSDSNKWNLSRYFNVNKAATQQTQNDVPVNSLVVNSMNVSMNEPTMLPGGAQIIPEPTPQQLAAAAAAAAAGQPNTAIVKNEASYSRAKNLSVQSDDEDDDDCDDRVGSATAVADQFRHPALLDDIKKESDALFPNSLIKAAAAAAANGQSQGANQQVPMLNASEFVAIPSNQIKPEPYGGKRSPIVSPRTRPDTTANSESGKKSATGDEFVRIERLSAPSTDSNSSDANETSTVPTLGPGGTLKIPGVPAAITALPPSPPQALASALAPTLPNSITVLPIDPLPAAQRRRQHKKQKPVVSRLRVDTSDEEEETVTATTTYKTGQAVTLSPVALRAVTAPGGKLYVDPVALAVAPATAKKGPGRPRKLPNSSATSATTSNASATTAKGPTLTAKKEVSGSGSAAKKAPSARRRVSRQNSTAASSTPTKASSVAAVAQPPLLPKQLQQLQAVGTRVTREPSADSTCSSSSYSTSKSSSSSSSDSDAASGDGGAGGGSSSDDDEDDAQQTTVKANRLTVEGALTAAGAAGTVSLPTNTTTTTTSRRILQINKRKPSLDDVVLAQPKLPVAADEDDDDDDDDSSSASSDDSSVTPAVDRIHSPAAAPPMRAVPSLGKTGGGAAGAGSSGGGSSHRSQNQQSPFKSAATVSTSSSSGSCSSSSSSSDGEHSDAELKTRGKAGSASAKRRRRDKPKASDKNKKDTLTRIFNPKEGGAKKQGQVLVIDQSGDQSDHQHQQQQQQSQQQKLISPIIAFRRTGSQENLTATAAVSGAVAGVAQSSPRLTPGHLRSPRALPSQLLVGAHRTPDRCSSSAERKLQQRIKTPTRTPTRTPPNTRTPTPTPAPGTVQHLPPLAATAASPARAAAVAPNTSGPSTPPSLICKIDLARIARIAPEWHMNSYRLYGSTPTAMYHHAGAGPPAVERRTAAASNTAHHYDHEAILNADLQAARLAAASGTGNASGGSGNGTPRSTGSRTPTPQGGERERERGKQRLNYSHSNGRLSSRSADGGGGGSGGTTPKELATPHLTPNGYTTGRGLATNRGGSSSPKSTKLIAGLKHEHIKNEPDLDGATVASTLPLSTSVYCSETKFKAGGAGATAAVKQELLLKHDYKPVSELPYATEKQLDATSVPVVAAAPEAKPRRKRSSSSSSSPYKEKKRKKDKHSKEGAAPTANVMPHGALPKDKEKEAEKKLDRMEGTSGNTSSKAVAVITPLGMGNNGQMEKEILLLDNHQLPPTNHDRLLGKQAPMTQPLLHHHQHHPQQQQQQPQQQQSLLIGGSGNMSTATPAHLQPTSNKAEVIMPPPTGADGGAGVGALTHQQQHDDKRPPPAGASATTQAPIQQVIYHSYFERDDDVVNDIFSKNSKFLQEAISRKHAADREQNTFKQVILYLEAVVYFLLSGAAMEYHRSSEDATWTMYKDTLALIKFISSKFKHLTVPSSSNELHEPHHKVAVLSLRCQSLISLKLYKMKRQYCRSVINLCTEFFKSNRSEIINGNTPSSNSPSNSVCSQGSGSNTPPGKMLRQDKIQRQDIHSALNQENQYFNYLASCHELWDQADRLVRQGNHTDFFIALDHENGPLTLHSSMYEVFRYVQAGLERLKGGTTVTTTATATSTTTNSNSNMSNVQH